MSAARMGRTGRVMRTGGGTPEDGQFRRVPIDGYGCADSDSVSMVKLPLDLPAITAWTAKNKAARLAYYARPNHFGSWER